MTVFLPGCHDERLTKRPLSCDTFGVGTSGDSGEDIKPFPGEGERDEFRPMPKKLDEDGLVKPLRMPRPTGERWSRRLLPTATCRLG